MRSFRQNYIPLQITAIGVSLNVPSILSRGRNQSRSDRGIGRMIFARVNLRHYALRSCVRPGDLRGQLSRAAGNRRSSNGFRARARARAHCEFQKIPLDASACLSNGEYATRNRDPDAKSRSSVRFSAQSLRSSRGGHQFYFGRPGSR